MRTQIILASLLVCILSSGAFAGRVWHYNPIVDGGEAQIMSGNTSIAMRSNGVWPVVATEEGLGCMLPGGWAKSMDGFSGTYIDGAVSADGTVAFADNQGSIMMLSKTGFANASYSGVAANKASVAFDNNGNLAVLHNVASDNLTMRLTTNYGSSWYTVNVGNMPITSDSYALGFDSYNQANVAFVNNSGNLGYATKGVMTGSNWVVSPSEVEIDGRVDMAMVSDLPYVVYNNNNKLRCAVYNPITFDWQVSSLGLDINGENFAVANNNDGGVGVAFVNDSSLWFAEYSNGNWSDIEQLCAAHNDTQVGIAYDYENYPVISYADVVGDLYIAYDPVTVVPEPATIALLSLGALLLRRKK